tara:strand:- start:229 stop:615 length:387 start_codon:yes stop_codon:yes gene_type:complete
VKKKDTSMARVTVEDCIEKIPNRFRLVLLAAHRARNISAGSEILLDRDNDKNPVVSLREIAEDKVELDSLTESLVSGLQRVLPSEEEEDAADEALLAIEAKPTPVEPDEAEMLKALQSDRDGAPDTRF